ncbi:FG-GAP repeat domain-containing protein [Saccharothrix syringae]|uniref:VCBS repeat-containing protein n=1 Tax=Saccharothrix syringae TaxID=103733 RepID=A0A5Q0GWF0_SACSY|nr:VCBS repeat-containing protein [Saccharothrix syringae]QFZ18309.1 VCBS repeat-containing protein [Saccharothrix syringae]
MTQAVRAAVAAVAVLCVCAALGVATRRPGLGAAGTARLAEGFRFTAEQLNTAPAGAHRERVVAPALRGIRSWISAVGAAVAATDLRGAGRPGDVCLVDPRDDSVTVRAVPGDPGDYPPVRLVPIGVPYDPTMAPMGCVPADLDEDGDTDLVVYYWGRTPLLFVNAGGVPGPDTFRARELLHPVQVWNSTALNVGDVDGDGHLDLLVGNYFPDGARVLDPDAGDDVRMAMQDSMSRARNAGANRILLTRPRGVDRAPDLVDASTALSPTAAGSWTLSIGLQDLDGDGLPEVYQANDFGPDQLMVNRSTPGRVVLTEVAGRRDLTTPKSEVLGHDSFKGMGVAFTYDRGARLPTIVVSNITTPYALHESNFAFVPDGDPADLARGELPYRERSERLGLARSGWCWDVKAGDFDNDGVDEILQANGFLKGEVDRWPLLQELAMGNDELLRHPWAWPAFGPGDDLSGHESNPFWVRGPNGAYTDLAPALGIAAPDNSRGLALGDVDGNGTLDVLVANQWEDSALLRNRAAAGTSAHLAFVRSAGPGAPEVRALGVQVELRHPDRPQRAQLYPANGHAGVSAAEIPLSLPGGRTTPVTVTWRDATGLHRAEVDVAPGRRTVVLNGNGTAVVR